LTAIIAAAITPTAPAAAAAATTTTTAAAAKATGPTALLGTGFVDRKATAAELLAIGGFDGRGAFGSAAHRHERETAGAAGSVIGHKSDFGHSAVLAKEVLEIVLGGVEGKISYVQFHWSI
jgi:hypothetical protein